MASASSAAILDTGFFIALFHRGDKHHMAADALYRSSRAARVLVSTVPTEVAYFIGAHQSYAAAIRFVQSIAQSRLQFELVTPTDLFRVVEIMEQYADARLDFVDATLVAVAERLNITELWTLDRRHFPMVRPRHATHFDLLP